MEKEHNVKCNSARAWMLAARPKTLAGAAVPVMIALALAWTDGGGRLAWIPAVLCLLFAFVMQIDANFVNDYFDFMKGSDDEHRLGPRRACASGWVTSSAMRLAMFLTTLLACIIGLPLVWYGGWPMIVVGVACIVFCLLYTTHLSYMGWGDTLVLVFFGLVPVCVTYYIQCQTVTSEAFVASAACGLVVDTLLVLNNYRDRDNDRRTGKMTLIVRIGEQRGLKLYLMLGVAAYLLGLVFLMNNHIVAFLLPTFYVILHIKTYSEMKKIHQGKLLNKVLGMTARNIFVYGLTVALGFIVSPTTAMAQGEELNHVRVTMNDGTMRDGYVTRYWSEGKGLKVMNRKFTMRENGVEHEYTADDVKAVEFVVPNRESQINENVITADVANPSTFRPRNVKRQFVHEEGTTPEGTVYWWNAVDKQQMQLGQLSVSTIYGIKLADENIIIPFMTGDVISMNALRVWYKKTNKKELVEHLDKRVLKGGKKLWRGIQENPMMVLELIKEYNNNSSKY